MSIKDFILSKTFLKNLALAAVIFVVIIMLLLIWMNFYTRHGQSKPVPDFKGLTLRQTEQLAKKADSGSRSLIRYTHPKCPEDASPNRIRFRVSRSRSAEISGLQSMHSIPKL